MQGVLRFWPLVSLIFFTVSGGAYGLENLVGAVGPGAALLLLVVVPVLWVVPVGLMVAELSCAIPQQGGYYIWVRRGLGPYWAVQEGWWTLCYAAVDLAIYPVLFTNYLTYFSPALAGSGLERWGITVLFIGAALLFNLRGISAVGDNALVSMLLVIVPFALIAGFGFRHPLPHLALLAPSGGQLATALAVLLWNYSGWDNVSTYLGEVQQPARNVPCAMLAALVIMTLSYLLPLLAGFTVTTDPADWSETRGWPVIARMLGGPWLGTLVAAAALVSAWAMFNSQLLYVSRLPAAMANDGVLPPQLGRVSATGAPVAALVVVSIVAAVFSALALNKLLVVDILCYTLALSLELFALIALRRKEPGLARPFRIPLGRTGLAILSAPPLLLALVVAVSSALSEEGVRVQLGVLAAVLVSGVIVARAGKRS